MTGTLYSIVSAFGFGFAAMAETDAASAVQIMVGVFYALQAIREFIREPKWPAIMP